MCSLVAAYFCHSIIRSRKTGRIRRVNLNIAMKMRSWRIASRIQKLANSCRCSGHLVGKTMLGNAWVAKSLSQPFCIVSDLFDVHWIVLISMVETGAGDPTVPSLCTNSSICTVFQCSIDWLWLHFYTPWPTVSGILAERRSLESLKSNNLLLG